MSEGVGTGFEDAFRDFRHRKAREFRFAADNLGQTLGKRQDTLVVPHEGSTRFHPPLILTPALRPKVSGQQPSRLTRRLCHKPARAAGLGATL